MGECLIINRPRTSGSYLPEYTYTGQHQLIDDKNGNWRIKILSTGQLRINKMVGNSIDIFLVGGGCAGGGEEWTANSYYGHGGSSGKTLTAKNVPIEKNHLYELQVGLGGSGTAYAMGETTRAFNYLAPGGMMIEGGSGGAAYGGFTGGSDGANGQGAEGSTLGLWHGSSPGKGQGSTTREFGEPIGKLYAGGGGGAPSGAGGLGGGGKAADDSLKTNAQPGEPNTGSGGGGCYVGYLTIASGGSGIIIIRNHAADVVKITRNPKNASVAVNATADFTVGASGRIFSYQWQFLPASGGAWANTSLSGYNTPTLHVQALTYRNNYQYRCVVTGAENSVTSGAATLTISGETKTRFDPIVETCDVGEIRE